MELKTLPLKSSQALRTFSSLVHVEKLHRDYLFDNPYPLAPSQAAAPEKWGIDCSRIKEQKKASWIFSVYHILQLFLKLEILLTLPLSTHDKLQTASKFRIKKLLMQ